MSVKFQQIKLKIYQAKSLILHFFLLILEILFNPALDIFYKYNRFFKTLLKKGLELILNKGNSSISFLSGFILFLLKVDLILEK